MRHAVVSEHREFFTRNHYIEFDDLFPAEDLADHVNRVLDSRLKKRSRTAYDLFMVGRDVWRNDSHVEKIVLNRAIAEVAADLFKQKTLRIAYDQAISTALSIESSFLKSAKLQEISCFQHLVGGVILRLTPDPAPPPVLPRKVGSGVFFGPDFVFPFPSLFQAPSQCFLLIAYCQEKTVYVLEKNDLHTHALKQLGYSFGDKMNNETHPIVFK